MKKNKLLITFLFMFIFSMSVKATCNNVELNDLAEKFNAMYIELDHGDLVFMDSSRIKYSDEYGYVVFLYPYSSKLKVIATDSITNTRNEIEKDEVLEAFSIPSYIHYKEKKYSIELYGADDSMCPGALLKTLNFTVPKFNEYSMYEHCEKNSDEEICKMMKNTSNISQDDYEEIVQESNEKNKIKNMPLGEKIIYYAKRYYLYALIPILLISTYYVIKIRKYKKRVENQ